VPASSTAANFGSSRRLRRFNRCNKSPELLADKRTFDGAQGQERCWPSRSSNHSKEKILELYGQRIYLGRCTWHCRRIVVYFDKAVNN
jgi:hypothetical protein